jgi:hypothetical protein
MLISKKVGQSSSLVTVVAYQYLFPVKTAYEYAIRDSDKDLSTTPCYFVSARRMREYAVGEHSTYKLQEEDLTNFLLTQSNQKLGTQKQF